MQNVICEAEENFYNKNLSNDPNSEGAVDSEAPETYQW